MRGNALRIDPRDGLTVDEQSVAPEHDRCFDSFALSNCSDEIPDAGHLESSRKVVAKLEIVNVEVKR